MIFKDRPLPTCQFCTPFWANQQTFLRSTCYRYQFLWRSLRILPLSCWSNGRIDHLNCLDHIQLLGIRCKVCSKTRLLRDSKMWQVPIVWCQIYDFERSSDSQCTFKRPNDLLGSSYQWSLQGCWKHLFLIHD